MMKIEVQNGKANVYTPYNPDFVKAIKGIGGAKWDSSERCWTIPETAVDAARIIMTEVYGYSDIKENKTVTLRVIFNERISKTRADIVLFGKILAHAYGRDSGAKVGDDVAYIEGGATSGGSAHNWNSIVKEGSVAILSNVNENVYKNEKPEYNITVEVINTKINEQELLDEKERLLNRIVEIDRLLHIK